MIEHDADAPRQPPGSRGFRYFIPRLSLLVLLAIPRAANAGFRLQPLHQAFGTVSLLVSPGPGPNLGLAVGARYVLLAYERGAPYTGAFVEARWARTAMLSFGLIGGVQYALDVSGQRSPALYRPQFATGCEFGWTFRARQPDGYHLGADASFFGGHARYLLVIPSHWFQATTPSDLPEWRPSPRGVPAISLGVIRALVPFPESHAY